ncbi:MAG TPA: DUF1508 domain-containing protein [Propionibacteriaceae bacterium]|nr:DUF1508 domain-containing protein [Propionibacteriaceae bacterium]
MPTGHGRRTECRAACARVSVNPWQAGLVRAAPCGGFPATRGVTISKFELYKDPHGAFRWKLKSTEGRIIAVSAEAHQTMADAQQNIAAVKREAGVSDIDDQTGTTF